MKTDQSNFQDTTMAYLAANGFFGLAGSFFSQLPQDLNASAALTYKRRGELVSAVTNLALSIELYLKALAIGTGAKVKRTHDLLELFDGLPKKLRESIELRYNVRLKDMPPDALAAIEMSITSKPIPPTDEEIKRASAQRPSGDDIRSILKAEKDAFRSWRYIHEAGVTGGLAFFRIDFHRLALIANTLQEHFGPKRKEPNKAPEPTSGIVTPRAEPRVAPIPPVAHL